jgi:pimeloyl-ACP methyl ester carboxylesterase
MTTSMSTGYAPVNGLQMYYEVHGTGVPLVLLHGALSATGTSFGPMVAELAKTRQVIAIEQQGHGHTADIDRPLSIAQMADDTAGLLAHLGIRNADVFGYSLGAGVAFDLAARYPELVRKQVLLSVSFNRSGFHPGLLEGIDMMTPDALAGSPFEAEYLEIAPNPADWATLVKKIVALDREVPDTAPDAVAAVTAPALLIIGDSDIITPEHIVEMFRLLGGGVMGDAVGLPKSQLAIIPGATHVSVVSKTDALMAIIPPFLDAP